MRRSGLVAFAAGWLLGRRRRGNAPQQGHAVTLRGQPDSRRRPSDGIVAEASIIARLLRLRLLTLHATVVVSPAVVTKSSTREPSARRPHAAATRTFDGPAQTYDATPARPVGRRLAQAARTVDESAATLAATRRG